MPERTQLNIKISSTILSEVKKAARMNGLTISDFVQDVISKELSSMNENARDLDHLLDRISRIEEEIFSVKTSCPGQIEKNKSVFADGVENN